MEIGRWREHTFEVSGSLVRSFTDLVVSGTSNTEEKTYGSTGYSAYKNGTAAGVTMTVQLNAYLGCDVRTEAIRFVREAQEGASGYLYIRGQKLLDCLLMLTSASAQEIEISPAGEWVKCEVKLAFKQTSDTDATDTKQTIDDCKSAEDARKSTGIGGIEKGVLAKYKRNFGAVDTEDTETVAESTQEEDALDRAIDQKNRIVAKAQERSQDKVTIVTQENREKTGAISPDNEITTAMIEL